MRPALTAITGSIARPPARLVWIEAVRSRMPAAMSSLGHADDALVHGFVADL